jgi:hypothetical protein
MYEFMQTKTGWLVYWGPAPAGIHDSAPRATERKVTRVSREQLAAATVRVAAPTTVAMALRRVDAETLPVVCHV